MEARQMLLVLLPRTVQKEFVCSQTLQEQEFFDLDPLLSSKEDLLRPSRLLVRNHPALFQTNDLGSSGDLKRETQKYSTLFLLQKSRGKEESYHRSHPEKVSPKRKQEGHRVQIPRF